MYKNILVPIAADHDPSTEGVLEVARALAADGAKITTLTVIEAMPGYVSAHLPEGQLEKTLRDVEAAMKAEIGAGSDISVKVVEGHSARSILDYADSAKVDCIVMASHRPDITDYFLGSTAARVVRRAKCAVHVLR